ncbi:MAG: hypothetical protein AB7F99_13955 [Vicinamibacterales bacterium]
MTLLNRVVLTAFCVFSLAAPIAAQQSPAGSWVLALATEPPQTLEATLIQNGERVTGQISSENGPVDAEGTYVNGVLTLYYSAYIGGQPSEITLSAAVTDAGMEGALYINATSEIRFTGRRKA